jgi:hypothetical protein
MSGVAMHGSELAAKGWREVQSEGGVFNLYALFSSSARDNGIEIKLRVLIDKANPQRVT